MRLKNLHGTSSRKNVDGVKQGIAGNNTFVSFFEVLTSYKSTDEVFCNEHEINRIKKMEKF